MQVSSFLNGHYVIGWSASQSGFMALIELRTGKMLAAFFSPHLAFITPVLLMVSCATRTISCRDFFESVPIYAAAASSLLAEAST